MAEISLKGLLMDNGVAADRWTQKLLHQYQAVDQLMKATAEQFEAECGRNPYLALNYVQKAVTGMESAGTVIRYRPELAWRVKSTGARLSGLQSWVTVEPFFRKDLKRSGRDAQAANLAKRLQRDVPATFERLKVYEVMKQRLRAEASLLYRVLQRLDEMSESTQWTRLEGNQDAVQEARQRLLALRRQEDVTQAVFGV